MVQQMGKARRRGQVSESAVGLFPIVVVSPRRRLFLGILRGRGLALIQVPLTNFAAEHLDKGIVRGIS